MSGNTWIAILRSGFSVLKENMESCIKYYPVKSQMPYYIAMRNFILAVTAQTSKNSCFEMLDKFLSDRKNVEMLKEGLVVETKDSISKGKIMSEPGVFFEIMVENDEINEKRVCELSKIYPFLYRLATNAQDKNQPQVKKQHSKEELLRIDKLNESYTYFICSLSAAIALFCSTSNKPNPKDAEEIYRKNKREKIPPKPSHFNGIEKLLKVFSSITEDEICGSVISGIVGGPENINSMKGVISSLNPSHITQVMQKSSVAVAAGNYGAVINHLAGLVSKSAVHIETKEDKKSYEQEF